jgi:DNA-binding NarL/FixJ family response regulator
MKILIADDHPITLFGTKSFVESLGYNVENICSNGIVAYNLIESHQPQIAILDINMPGISGIEVAQKVQKNKLPCKIILLTMLNERSVYNKATECGVMGYLLKNFSTDELDDCLKAVTQNKHYVSPHLENELITEVTTDKDNLTPNLTLAERKILELISQQKRSKQIAEMLFISEKTVEGHRRNIIEKLGLPKEKNAILVWALQNFKNTSQ